MTTELETDVMMWYDIPSVQEERAVAAVGVLPSSYHQAAITR